MVYVLGKYVALQCIIYELIEHTTYLYILERSKFVVNGF